MVKIQGWSRWLAVIAVIHGICIHKQHLDQLASSAKLTFDLYNGHLIGPWGSKDT